MDDSSVGALRGKVVCQRCVLILCGDLPDPVWLPRAMCVLSVDPVWSSDTSISREMELSAAVRQRKKKLLVVSAFSSRWRTFPPAQVIAGAGRIIWTKCVFAASAEAVEAENLFFVLGGPTSYMALSGERSAPTLRPRKHNYEALQLRASTRPHAARVKFKSLTPLTMTPKVSIG